MKYGTPFAVSCFQQLVKLSLVLAIILTAISSSALALSLRGEDSGLCLTEPGGNKLRFDPSTGTVTAYGPDGSRIGSGKYTSGVELGVPFLEITYGGSWLLGIPEVRITNVGLNYSEIQIGADWLYVNHGGRIDVYERRGEEWVISSRANVPEEIKRIYDAILNFLRHMTECTGLPKRTL